MWSGVRCSEMRDNENIPLYERVNVFEVSYHLAIEQYRIWLVFVNSNLIGAAND